LHHVSISLEKLRVLKTLMTETLSAVRDNPALSRFELETEAGVAVALYRASPGRLAIYHTEVPAALRERGIASKLIQGALEHARAQGLKVQPRCGFVHHYMDTHPEFKDVAG
jgi:predicted GNAT family acetyltransferase